MKSINCLYFSLYDNIISTVVDSSWAGYVIRLNALPQSVCTADRVLPQAQSTIFTSACIKLAIWWESHAVNRSKMTFEWLCTETFTLNLIQIKLKTMCKFTYKWDLQAVCAKADSVPDPMPSLPLVKPFKNSPYYVCLTCQICKTSNGLSVCNYIQPNTFTWGAVLPPTYRALPEAPCGYWHIFIP